MSLKRAFITHTGSYLPNKILTNADLEKMVDTSNEWIITRTGMKERRIAAEDEFTSDMGYKAAKKCLEKAGIGPSEIDLIIVATITPDHIFPSTACLIQKLLGANRAAAFDIQAACSGLLYGLGMAKSFVESGQYKKILIIGSEKLSSIVDYEDRSTCVLFGDGAAACLVQDSQSGLRIDAFQLGADGVQSDLLILPAGGCRKPASLETLKNRDHFLKMDGREVFKHAVRRMEQSMIESIEKAGLNCEDIDWLVPHQANIRIINSLARRCGIDDSRVIKTGEKYGNTSASSIGIGLDEMLDENLIKEGNNLLLIGFGAGLTWGSIVLKMVRGQNE